MNLPVQDWMFKLEDALKGLTGHFVSAKTAVLEESATLSARLDRIEGKLDQVLESLRQGRGA